MAALRQLAAAPLDVWLLIGLFASVLVYVVIDRDQFHF